MWGDEGRRSLYDTWGGQLQRQQARRYEALLKEKERQLLWSAVRNKTPKCQIVCSSSP